MSAEMDDLKAKVAAEDMVIGSAVTLLNDLGARIAAVAGDKQATLDLAADVSTQTQALADAVAANTPAA